MHTGTLKLENIFVESNLNCIDENKSKRKKITVPNSSRSRKNSISLSPEKASEISEEKERKVARGYRPDNSSSSTKPASRSTSRRPSTSSIHMRLSVTSMRKRNQESYK